MLSCLHRDYGCCGLFGRRFDAQFERFVVFGEGNCWSAQEFWCKILALRMQKAALLGGFCVISSFERSRILSRNGGDLLSHVLRRSTISATVLNGRVRDGIGCFTCAMTTKPRKYSSNTRDCHFRTFVQSYYYWIKSSLSGN